MTVGRPLHPRLARSCALALLVGAPVLLATVGDVSPVRAVSTTLVISEFRLRGPSGANDEFIEIQNISAADLTVAGGGTGFAVAASDGVARCVIPNGTVIQRYGHYLCTNSVAYSIASYAAGNGTTATGDATYTTDIPDNAGIALFDTSVGGQFDVAHRIDAVGSTSEANTTYKEGAGYPALTPFSIDYSFYRNLSTAQVNAAAVDTLTPGISEDTDVNATDFVFVDTNGTSAGAGQRLGTPGPENLSSPVVNGGLAVSLLDSCVGPTVAPNAVRDLTSVPAQNSTFGTVDFRRTITNNTGGDVTRLRFRIADQRTFPAASGWADMRDRTSADAVVTVDRAPCGSGTSDVTVNGTTLEQPPSQPNGSAFNSSLSAGTVTLGTPLAAGASIDVRFLFGIQQVGNNSVNIVVEALTAGATTAPSLTCMGISGDMTNLCVPVAVADNYGGTEDTPLTVAAPGLLANDTGPDADPLTVAPGSVSVPSNGIVSVSANGSFTYTPNANYNGPDSFTYRATDGTDESANATVSLTIAAVNDAPLAADDNYPATEDTPLIVAPPGLLANDSDPEGGAITIEAASVTAPANGIVGVNADGSFTYTPNVGYNGADSFTYTATDGALASNTATVNLTISAANDAPVAVNDAFALTEDTPLTVAATGILGNDTDADGDTITAVLDTGPTYGTVALNDDGSFTYTPNANYNGPDAFTYVATDSTADSNTATVALTVAAVNDPPVAANDAFNATEDVSLTVTSSAGVLVNDSDVESSALTAAVVVMPAHGTVTLNANGSFTFTPHTNYSGQDSFTYHANDATADSNTATVNIIISAVNDPPTAVDDAVATVRNAPLISPSPGPLANDVDADGDPLTAILVSPPSHGTLILDPDGAYLYTPDPGYVGTDEFTYAAFDGMVASSPVTVTFTISGPTGDILPVTGTDSKTAARTAAGVTLIGGLTLLARRRRVSARTERGTGAPPTRPCR